MEQTTLKLMVRIDQYRIGYHSRGEMVITDMMFSESHYKFLDVGELTTELKQCIKAMKGWSIITISLTDDITYSTYPKAVNEVRFVNSYGDIKMSYAEGNYFHNWTEAKTKDVYAHLSTFVSNANLLQLEKLKQSSSTEVANA